jgi:hypothetical protein
MRHAELRRRANAARRLIRFDGPPIESRYALLAWVVWDDDAGTIAEAARIARAAELAALMEIEARQCAANTRRGERCRRLPVPGRRYCQTHG